MALLRNRCRLWKIKNPLEFRGARRAARESSREFPGHGELAIITILAKIDDYLQDLRTGIFLVSGRRVYGLQRFANGIFSVLGGWSSQHAGQRLLGWRREVSTGISRAPLPNTCTSTQE